MSRPNDINPETGQPFWATCDQCNYDRHICHGCGGTIEHEESVCDDCQREHFEDYTP